MSDKRRHSPLFVLRDVSFSYGASPVLKDINLTLQPGKFYGIIGPNGKFLAEPLEAEEGILYAEIDLNDIIAAKRMFDVSGHYARPDVFDVEK